MTSTAATLMRLSRPVAVLLSPGLEEIRAALDEVFAAHGLQVASGFDVPTLTNIAGEFELIVVDLAVDGAAALLSSAAFAATRYLALIHERALGDADLELRASKLEHLLILPASRARINFRVARALAAPVSSAALTQLGSAAMADGNRFAG